MKSIVELALRLSDLVEAEGRLAKRHALGLALAIAMIAAATVFAVLAVMCLVAGLFLALRGAMHDTAALCVIAGILAIVSLLAGLLAREFYRYNARSRARRSGGED